MPLPIVRAPNTAPAAIIGIDLGTTFSLSASMVDGQPKMVRDADGDARVPSAIGFGPRGEVTIGFEARRHAVEDPEHTVYSIKRLIGRTLEDLKDDLQYVPYQVVEREQVGGRKVLHVRIAGREYTPEELSAMILREVAARASAAIGLPVQKAVITVPAYFDESQRQATRDAGRIAGLDVVRIINEPTAAALAYGLQAKVECKVAVYDLGGGTFDCSILQLKDCVFKVLSTHGDTHLGGDDFDNALTSVFAADFAAFVGREDASSRQALRDACERLKIALTSAEEADLVVRIPDEGREFRRTYTRAAFEKLLEPFVERTIASCRAALRDADLSPGDVDEVVLVGGSSRIPLVRKRVAELFGRPPHCDMNPDEVVALGAAVQGAVLTGQLRNVLLLDITPLSLGIETIGGAVSRLIPRNSTIPSRATERFSTFVDGQTAVEIHVLQGERELAKDCRSLGRFRLTGLPPMPAGLPQIDVTFLLDANGMLQVTARENRSGKAATIDVQPSHGLTREEVERAIRESVEKAREDFDARRLVELRTKAEANLRHTRKGLADAGDQVPDAVRASVNAAVAAVESARIQEGVQQLQKALDELDAATQPLAEMLMDAVLAAEVVRKRLSEV